MIRKGIVTAFFCNGILHENDFGKYRLFLLGKAWYDKVGKIRDI